MDIPEEYKENLEKRIITYEMLDCALFAVNKRAKNWRDIKRERKRDVWADAECLGFKVEDTAEDAEKMEREMYDIKQELLTVLPPACIHQEFAGYRKQFVYDTDGHYDDLYLNALFHNAVCDKGSGWKDGKQQEYFLMETSVPRYRYYLVRFMGNHAFHTPISEESVQSYAESYAIPVILTGKILTVGLEEQMLAPMEYVEAMLQLVRSGDYTYVDADRKQEIREPFAIEKKKYVMPGKYDWKSVLAVLQKHYPEEKGLDKAKLSPRMWRKLISKPVTVERCMKVLREERGTGAKHIVVAKRQRKNVGKIEE